MTLQLIVLAALLPVAFLSGWWVGQRALRKKCKRDCPDFSADYFRGLNYLLNEQQDKAIDVFVQMLEVDSETVETHLALGNLFRTRGEVDRAIRIHQNLIARPTLSKQQSAQALLELARDYLRAGLLGRAESLFLELFDQGLYKREALEHLLDIYQQEQEWQKAIDAARRLENAGGEKMAVRIAHFHCELATQALQDDELKVALKQVKQALSIDRNSVRATLMKAGIEQRNGRHKAVLKTLGQIEQQDPAFLSEAVPILLESYRALGRLEAGEKHLCRWHTEYGGISALLGVAELLQARQGERAAAARVLSYLRTHPSLRGLQRLLELQLNEAQGELHGNLVVIKGQVDKLLKEKLPYRCGNCGFEGKKLCWQCPGCKQWGTIRPIQGIAGK